MRYLVILTDTLILASLRKNSITQSYIRITLKWASSPYSLSNYLHHSLPVSFPAGISKLPKITRIQLPEVVASSIQCYDITMILVPISQKDVDLLLKELMASQEMQMQILPLQQIARNEEKQKIIYIILCVEYIPYPGWNIKFLCKLP